MSADVPAAGSASAGESPSLLWRDVTAVSVTCLVHTDSGVDTGALQQRICTAVQSIAARAAPVPVAVQPLGSETLKAGTVTLLVQANVVAVRGTPVVALSIRPFRNVADSPGLLFAAPPQALPADDPAALEGAIQTILARTLPWLANRRDRLSIAPQR